jgi:beta-glucosidase
MPKAMATSARRHAAPVRPPSGRPGGAAGRIRQGQAGGDGAITGRPLYTNDLLNLSDSFVAAWLPGTEGKGVTDVLFRKADGKINKDFRGKLSFSWPKSACQSPLNVGDANYDPLFKYGYGLNYSSKTTCRSSIPAIRLAAAAKLRPCPVYNPTDRSTYALYVSSGGQRVALGADLNAVFNLPTVKVETAQVNTQQDAKRLTWTGPAKLEAQAAKAIKLPAYASRTAALQFDAIVAGCAARQGRGRHGDGGAGRQRCIPAAGRQGQADGQNPAGLLQRARAALAALSTPFSVAADAPLPRRSPTSRSLAAPPRTRMRWQVQRLQIIRRRR